MRARRDQRDQLAVMLDRIAEIGRLQAEIGERRARRGLMPGALAADVPSVLLVHRELV